MTELPDGWKVVPLGEVADTTLGKMLDGGKIRRLPNVPYLRNVNVQWGRIDTDDLLTMELADGDRERFAVQPGDLLVCEGGEIGRAAIWNGRTEYLAFQKALHRIRSRGNLDLSYVRYLFELYRDDGTLRRFATGSTIAHLPQQKLRALPVPLPPLDEQRRIVDILEDHLSRLDAAEAGLGETLERVRLLRVSSLAHNVRSQEESETGSLMFGDRALALAPGWASGCVAQAAELVEYGTSSKTHEGQRPGDVPVLRMGNVKDGRLVWGSLKYLASDNPGLQKIMLRPGDLLFNRTNSAEHVGKTAVFEGEQELATFASYLIRVRFRPEVDPRWANMVINSPYGRAYVTSVTSQQVGQANVNGTKLKAFPLPIPSLGEQIARIRRHAEVVDRADRLLFEVQTAAQRLLSLRRSLLDAAFSGRLTGRSSDLEMVEEMAGV